ncbi:MAG: GtrA family protein [Bacilli bacterium]|nr:GtrA family protein [Bacilli bacterium]
MIKKYIPLFKQAMHFFLVSGVGWLIDMSIYVLLSRFLPLEVTSIISSGVAVTYVYFVSTRKIFDSSSKFNIKTKYIFYVVYQIFMILLSSAIIGFLNRWLLNRAFFSFIVKYSKICAKIIVTPFTMVANFVFMKILMEKI